MCRAAQIQHPATPAIADSGSGSQSAGRAATHSRAMSLRDKLVHHIGTDARLAMILMFGVLAVAGITPFAFIRALNSEWVAAGLDTVLVLLISGGVLYAWRTGRSELVGKVLAVGVSATGALLTETVGTTSQFWAYAVVLANFVLAPRWLAVTCSLVLVAAQLAFGNLGGFMPATAFLVSTLLVMMYAYIFASLTENQRGKLEQLASRDPLTGLGNRRSLEGEIEDAARTHLALGEPATLAVIDLDHFKRVNDEHGHDTGDRVLVTFTERVQACIRSSDRLYRLGGEEFVLLLPGTDRSGARVALEKVRDAVQATPLLGELRVTASVGAATLAPDDDWQRWLGRADDALYQAKDAGRDHVSFGPAPVRQAYRHLRLVPGRPMR